MNNEPISREQFARLTGGAGAAFGAVVLLVAWLSASYWNDAVAKCNTVVADMYNRSNPESGAKCAVANFVVDFRWMIVALSLMALVGGICRFVTADPEVRAKLGLDEDGD